MKKLNNSPEFDREREHNVVLERLHSDIKIILENQDNFSRKLDASIRMIARNTEDIVEIKLRLISMETRLGNVETRLDNVEIDLATVKKDVGIIKIDFGKRLNRLEATIK